jgi:hypothetical protein
MLGGMSRPRTYPPDVGRLLELVVMHSPTCACGEEAHARLARDVIAALDLDPVSIILDAPARTALVTVPTVWTVYDLLRLFGSVRMVATRGRLGGESLPVADTLAWLRIRDDEVIFLRSLDGLGF